MLNTMKAAGRLLISPMAIPVCSLGRALSSIGEVLKEQEVKQKDAIKKVFQKSSETAQVATTSAAEVTKKAKIKTKSALEKAIEAIQKALKVLWKRTKIIVAGGIILPMLMIILFPISATIAAVTGAGSALVELYEDWRDSIVYGYGILKDAWNDLG